MFTGAYAILNDNNVPFVVIPHEPTVLPVERNKPEIDPVIQSIQENSIKDWEVKEDRVVVTYTITDKIVDDEREKFINFVKNKLYDGVKNGGLTLDIDDGKVFVSTTEAIKNEIDKYCEKLADDEEIEWLKDPVEWQIVTKKQLKRMKDTIEDHYKRCDENLEDLLGIVDTCQTIQALNEIEYWENWPNTLVVTYEDGTIKLFFMKDLVDEEGFVKYYNLQEK